MNIRVIAPNVMNGNLNPPTYMHEAQIILMKAILYNSWYGILVHTQGREGREHLHVLYTRGGWPCIMIRHVRVTKLAFLHKLATWYCT